MSPKSGRGLLVPEINFKQTNRHNLAKHVENGNFQSLSLSIVAVNAFLRPTDVTNPNQRQGYLGSQ